MTTDFCARTYSLAVVMLGSLAGQAFVFDLVRGKAIVDNHSLFCLGLTNAHLMLRFGACYLHLPGSFHLIELLFIHRLLLALCYLLLLLLHLLHLLGQLLHLSAELLIRHCPLLHLLLPTLSL